MDFNVDIEEFSFLYLKKIFNRFEFMLETL